MTATPSFLIDDLMTLLQLDPNERYVPMAHVCDKLGLDMPRQLRRVRDHALLNDGIRRVKMEYENGTAIFVCLRIDLIPLWLAGADLRGTSDPNVRELLTLHQRECASILWQSFRPQGFSSDDALLPPPHQQNSVEQAYRGVLAEANLARHQMLIERQLEHDSLAREDQSAALGGPSGLVSSVSAKLAQAVRRAATTLSGRTRRNEYSGAYSGLARQFGISSYRRMPLGRLQEAIEWLERWYGDLMGEPEPPPDI
jgi:hypothetical protein